MLRTTCQPFQENIETSQESILIVFTLILHRFLYTHGAMKVIPLHSQGYGHELTNHVKFL